jgi:hypothetical protein
MTAGDFASKWAARFRQGTNAPQADTNAAPDTNAGTAPATQDTRRTLWVWLTRPTRTQLRKPFGGLGSAVATGADEVKVAPSKA